ncbi:hypothetical protein K450DRAFT_238262 [Umbelopsis ramanniana AG]|uniref:F-box domain-containing protein n=1 Tax=Umbelopsis ramanniana AG TaxID=1314678 RepID=A0AAD5E9Y7_UMBRA|nr:uncharacterized protein K450DRAFT_238262 [Umbelopsis ramanniana AG]KAI8580123.1 hypothetical protein K450DRAFT_238262 [Umbelopsis ramanniana AG]
MQSNGNGKLKSVSRLIGRMKTLQVKAQRKDDADDTPSPPPHVHRAVTHKSSPNIIKKLSNDQFGLRKAYTAGDELADLDFAPFLGDDDRFRPNVPNELWQGIFELLDVDSLFSCHQVSIITG